MHPQSKKFFKCKVQVQPQSQNNRKMQPFHNKNAAFLLHWLRPNPVPILNSEWFYSPDPIQIQQILL